MNKKYISNVAQIILIVIFLPIICWLFGLFMKPKDIMDMFANLVGEIPLFNTWTSILYSSATFEAGNILAIYCSSFFEAVIMGICIGILNAVGKVLNKDLGIPILSAFFGVLAGCIIIKAIGITEGFQLLLYIIISIIGIMLMIKAVFPFTHVEVGKGICKLIIDALVAVMTCGYVVALSMFSARYISLSVLLTVIALTIVALVISYIAIKAVEADQKL